jgi:hypothetical protein
MRPDSRSESGGCPHVEMGRFGAVQLDTVRSTAPDGSFGSAAATVEDAREAR